MSLKAVLFEFNGLILNDEVIQQQVLAEILLEENLIYNPSDYRKYCLGRSDRHGLTDLLAARDRIVTETYLAKLLKHRRELYLTYLTKGQELSIYPNFKDFLELLKQEKLTIGMVTGALTQEIKLVLDKMNISSYFSLIISGDTLTKSKPEGESYLLACEKLGLSPQECLAIETSFVGIQAAKKAKIQVVGLANLYPVHLLQRRVNWVVDYLHDLELDRIKEVFQKIC